MRLGFRVEQFRNMHLGFRVWPLGLGAIGLAFRRRMEHWREAELSV
jgi:hypothetical protein